MKELRFILSCIVLLLAAVVHAQVGHGNSLRTERVIIVDPAGKGDFSSIQAAINALPGNADHPRHILLKKGIYSENVYIDQNNIILEGEDRDKTILTQAIARDAWRCEHSDDWGVATLNLRGSDITLRNVTIQNSYGFDNKGNTDIACAGDSLTHRKTIRPDGHQMALRSFATTRLKVVNCVLRAFGGDTVSPWNVDEGMFYFKDCVMEGGVDFYCPRGWAFAENCSFIAHTGPACIWHDGSRYRDSKTVLKNCTFTGYDGFKLGRYHRDAQFYLIGCTFAANMADTAIYRVPTANTIQWGHRVYYYNCHRKGKDYTWYADNLASAPGAPAAASITAAWVFGSRWNPAE
ncbi:MAG: pectinesterase [Bacteroidetes bacterium]|nr:pectinesterase [Bacteroidota bacterium]